MSFAGRSLPAKAGGIPPVSARSSVSNLGPALSPIGAGPSFFNRRFHWKSGNLI